MNIQTFTFFSGRGGLARASLLVDAADPFAGQDVIPGKYDDAEIEAGKEEPLGSSIEMTRTHTGGVEVSFPTGRRRLPIIAVGLLGLILVAGGLYG